VLVGLLLFDASAFLLRQAHLFSFAQNDAPFVILFSHEN
jgi:hypothetical protein